MGGQPGAPTETPLKAAPRDCVFANTYVRVCLYLGELEGLLWLQVNLKWRG